MENTCNVNPRPKTFKEMIKSSWFLRPFLGAVIGGIAGFLYYHYAGCSTGTCAITSSPYGSTIMGGLIGIFITNSPCSRGCK